MLYVILQEIQNTTADLFFSLDFLNIRNSVNFLNMSKVNKLKT